MSAMFAYFSQSDLCLEEGMRLKMEISWLDFSEKDRKKVITVMEMLKEPGAVDELGIGIIRDYYANKFFPGTSTLHTHAKYFILSYYIGKDLEKHRYKNYKEYLDKFSQKEEECAKKLCKANGNEEKGIIGSLSLKRGNWVKRGPADMYWSALRQFGIFKNKKLTLSSYAKILVEKNKNEDEIYKQLWEESTIYKENWMKELNQKDSIKLKKEEAEFLKERIILTQRESLLAKCLEKNIKEFTLLKKDEKLFDNFESLIDKLDLSTEMKAEYKKAKNMSDFLYCAQIRYNCVISKDDIKITEIWNEYKAHGKEVAKKVDIDIIGHDTSLYRFMRNLQEYMLSDEEKIEDKIDKLVISREKEIKNQERAKLSHPFDTKGQWQGLNKLSYRIDIAQDLAYEIMEGLSKNI